MTDIEIKPVPPSLIAREAIKDIKRLSWSMRGWIYLGQQLGEFADLQALMKQEEDRLASVKAKARKTEADATARLAAVEQEETKVAGLREQSQALADHCEAEQQRAAEIINKANIQAAVIVDDATAQAKETAERTFDTEMARLVSKARASS